MHSGNYGFTLVDDATQGDPAATREVRNTYFFPDAGGCYLRRRREVASSLRR